MCVCPCVCLCPFHSSHHQGQGACCRHGTPLMSASGHRPAIESPAVNTCSSAKLYCILWQPYCSPLSHPNKLGQHCATSAPILPEVANHFCSWQKRLLLAGSIISISSRRARAGSSCGSARGAPCMPRRLLGRVGTARLCEQQGPCRCGWATLDFDGIGFRKATGSRRKGPSRHESCDYASAM